MDELERVGKKAEVEFGPEIQPMVNELIYRDIKEKGIEDHDLYHKILKQCMMNMEYRNFTGMY